ncbi:MAG: hypothetical protein A2W61_06805 [Deltaproteobacteria bacterium RIFCSPLOWO2_01_44_7]|nr:MAG: hypothetical protein A2712_00980 [Deltaproteobacteria bacterium RIFCSPHIGHO2_01_FULL_43_49]OGQ15288.1 MAG: hypothetical protein A3D22_04495 [Deltaproteobacteria bacterium RIFCSPHIGHO2_02_FULL_44_53]OGQ27088.1 MAG: hypothetical protein A3D98_01570 [Deltaproteobacteria bacterium RIFCSPHIGHO2_12_FULL_44_21]OGQ31804.1 MAG: hypothetical protein A2979_05655 [Deltaproteobacteria bacterium RIFCSPLOWO2_01_FULL_45_74]OGQ39763.1 MAG: hypothetical protein A2W61_06805 [Deltaproteobacteria bacterium 
MQRGFIVLLLICVAGCSSYFTPYHSETAPSLESGILLAGTIIIDSKLHKKIQPSDTLYIIAKKGDGMPPLAVKKMAVGAFPLKFELGSQDIMMHGASLEGDVILVARIDQDGMAGPPQKGDLEGRTAKPISIGDQSIEIKIDKSF